MIFSLKRYTGRPFQLIHHIEKRLSFRYMHPHIPGKCQFRAEGIVADFNFLSIADDGEIELYVELSCRPEYGDLVFKPRSFFYPISHLRLLIRYLEEHLSRISEGKYARAPHAFLLWHNAFMIDALSAVESDTSTEFGIEFFIGLGGVVPLPHLLVGFLTTIDVADVTEFLVAYSTILDNIEADLQYPNGGLFPGF